MEEQLIKSILKITEKEKMTRKAIYEHLLVSGKLKPGSESLFNLVVDNALDSGKIPSGRIKVFRKARGKLPTVFTTTQLVSIFEACKRPKLSVVMWLGFFCGLRIREACNLKVADVDLDRRKVFVRDSKNPLRGKQGYGKDRVVSIPHKAIAPLKRWKEVIKGGTWFVPSMQSPNKAIQTKTIHEQYRQLLTELGLSEVEYQIEFKQKNHGKKKDFVKSVYKYKFHTLRHTYATYLLEKGVPLENIQRTLGHKDLETTLVYARVSDTKTSDLIDESFDSPIRIAKKDSVLNLPVQHNVYNDNKILAVKQGSPVEILQRRFAMGEIDERTYDHMVRKMVG